jgi:hypothetical protein
MRKLKVKKKEAHRKQIRISSKKSDKNSKISEKIVDEQPQAKNNKSFKKTNDSKKVKSSSKILDNSDNDHSQAKTKKSYKKSKDSKKVKSSSKITDDSDNEQSQAKTKNSCKKSKDSRNTKTSKKQIHPKQKKRSTKSSKNKSLTISQPEDLIEMCVPEASTSTAPIVRTRRAHSTVQTVQYPCSVCSDDCSDNCVQCDGCEAWTHFECLGLSGTEEELGEDEWLCPFCR